MLITAYSESILPTISFIKKLLLILNLFETYYFATFSFIKEIIIYLLNVLSGNVLCLYAMYCWVGRGWKSGYHRF